MARQQATLDEWAAGANPDGDACELTGHDRIFVMCVEGVSGYLCLNATTNVMFTATYERLVMDNGANCIVLEVGV